MIKIKFIIISAINKKLVRNSDGVNEISTEITCGVPVWVV